MQFKLASKGRPHVFVPYKTHKKHYHLLFTSEVPEETLLSVKTSEDIVLDTFFYIGDLTVGGYDGKKCGYIFYSMFPVLCHGTCIVAYSKQWAKVVNDMTSIKPFGVSLLLRAKHFYVYHRRNNATLIVNPALAKHIRDNLEI